MWPMSPCNLQWGIAVEENECINTRVIILKVILISVPSSIALRSSVVILSFNIISPCAALCMFLTLKNEHFQNQRKVKTFNFLN